MISLQSASPSLPTGLIVRMTEKGVEFKGGSLRDGFGGFDGCGGSGDSVESTLPSFCWPYKIQDKEAAVTVLAVMAVSVATATPLKLNPLFRHTDICCYSK